VQRQRLVPQLIAVLFCPFAFWSAPRNLVQSK
jgi:hypothetical protein